LKNHSPITRPDFEQVPVGTRVPGSRTPMGEDQPKENYLEVSRLTYRLTMNFFGIFLLALLASLAEVEAQKISDRTKTGMVRANAKGAFLFLVSSPDLEWIERQ
jgi:hypothetical protein